MGSSCTHPDRAMPKPSWAPHRGITRRCFPSVARLDQWTTNSTWGWIMIIGNYSCKSARSN